VAACFAAPLSAEEFELPARKAGQWEIRMISEAGPMPEMVIQQCLDPATDREMMQAGLSMSKGMCERMEMSRSGDAFIVDSTCKVSGMTTESHVVVSGDFQSAYTIDITSKMSGGHAGMPGSMTMRQEARWIGGSCTGGLTPGDMLMPGGMKVRPTDMMKAMGG